MRSYTLLAQFAMFMGLANEAEEKGHDASPDKAAAAFSFLLFLIYMALSGTVYRYRNDVIGTGNRSTSTSSDAVVQSADAAQSSDIVVSTVQATT